MTDCQKCGENPQECPVVLCAPCAIGEAAAEDRKLVGVETWSLKRLAWAFGCAPAGSSDERALEACLRDRIARTR